MDSGVRYEEYFKFDNVSNQDSVRVIENIRKVLEELSRDTHEHDRILEIINYLIGSNYLNEINNKYLKTLNTVSIAKCNEDERNDLKMLIFVVIQLLDQISNRVPSCLEQYESLIDKIELLNHKLNDENEDGEDIKICLNSVKSKKENCVVSSNNDDEPVAKKRKFNKYADYRINFRDLSIIPKMREIEQPEIIRPNLKSGAFKSVYDYLDIQFKLFREDYVEALRNSIRDYRIVKQSNGKCNLDDRYIYENASLTRAANPNDASRFDVDILLTKKLAKLNWKKNKRLLPGSLIALSCDTFKTGVFGTIRKRTIDEKNEFLNVTVDLVDGEDINTKDKYTLIESSSYFECYNHTLKTLQKIEIDCFPLMDLIVECNTKEIKYPKYIKNKLDFSCLIKIKSLLRSKFDRVPLENLNEWPRALNLRLDESQYEALKNALQNRLSIIQGPPGTGKTFMGLKIVDFLLQNSNDPIMIVCYTNHALDQFLALIKHKLDNKNSLIRLGNRSSNLELNDHSLDNVMNNKLEKVIKEFNLNKSQDVYTYDELTSEKRIKNSLKERYPMGVCNYLFINCMKCFSTLKDEVIEEFYNVFYDGYIPDTNEIFMDWLGLGDYGFIDRKTIRQILSGELSPRLMNKVDKQKKVELENKLTFKTKTSSKNVDVDKIKDLWRLPQDDRIELYKLIHDQWDQYKQFLIKQVKRHIKRKVLNNIKIIGMTTTGAAKYQYLISGIESKVVLVEEAAEVFEQHIIACLPKTIQHLILIGDHKQLKPSPGVYKLAKDYNLDLSLFERLINNNFPSVRLTSQHRMRPEISLLMHLFYPDLVDADSVRLHDHIRGVEKSVLFINHSNIEDESDDSTSVTNTYEAEYAVMLSDFLLKQNYEPRKITILSPYVNQMFLIKRTIAKFQAQKERNMTNSLKNVRVTVIDNYQGEENDIIILTLVRSNRAGKIGFLATPNRACVALSRAKMGFYVIGNFNHFATYSSLWSKIVMKLKKVDSISDTLKLHCDKHKEKIIAINKVGDFDQIKDGICQEICNERLTCGHSCELKCHSIDHETLKCHKPCSRKSKNCSQDHRCTKRCCDDCVECIEIVEKPLRCSHKVHLECSKNPDNVICKETVEKVFDCGHKTNLLCIESLTAECQEKVPRYLPHCKHTQIVTCSIKEVKCIEVVTTLHPKCAHELKIPCFENNEDLLEDVNCTHPISVTSKCNHKSEIIIECHKVNNNIDDLNCNLPCGENLNCGHECVKKCHGTNDSHDCGTMIEVTLDCEHKSQIKCPTIKYHTEKDEDDRQNAELLDRFRNKIRKIKCKEYVKKKLKCNHYAEKVLCFESVRNYECQEEVYKEIDYCGHQMKMPCYLKVPENVKCREIVKVNCEKCQHDIEIKCFQENDKKFMDELKCDNQIEKVLSCGHSAKLPCFKPIEEYQCQVNVPVYDCNHHPSQLVKCHLKSEESKNVKPCQKSCSEILSCGHPCTNVCNACRTIGHSVCERNCNKQLICGHRCKLQCGIPCFSCNQQCLFECPHRDKCNRLCYEPCPPCMKPCEWSCRHHTCRKTCGEKCYVRKCNQNCSKILPKCGHKCQSVCGERCLCLQCNDRRVYETSKSKRFLKLINCQCIIELQKMDAHMDDEEKRLKDILGFPRCPYCKTPILISYRYANVVRNQHYKLNEFKMSKLMANFDMKGWHVSIEIYPNHFKQYLNSMYSIDQLQFLKNSINCLQWYEKAISTMQENPSCFSDFVFNDIRRFADITKNQNRFELSNEESLGLNIRAFCVYCYVLCVVEGPQFSELVSHLVDNIFKNSRQHNIFDFINKGLKQIWLDEFNLNFKAIQSPFADNS